MSDISPCMVASYPTTRRDTALPLNEKRTLSRRMEVGPDMDPKDNDAPVAASKGVVKELTGPFDLLNVDGWAAVFEFVEVSVMVRATCKAFNELSYSKYDGDCVKAYVTRLCAVGHSVELLAWAIENHCPTRELIWAVAASGNVDAMEWLVSTQDCHTYGYISRAMHNAAKGAHVEMIKWIYRHPELRNNCVEACTGAARGGHTALLKMLRIGLGCEWNCNTFVWAASHGDMDMLQWMKEENCPWNSSVYPSAAAAGRFDVVKWARKMGCPWDWQLYTGAASGGHLDIMMWARENGCSLSIESDESYLYHPTSAAAASGNLEILKWLCNEGCLWHETTMDEAAGAGHLRVVEWLWDAKCPYSVATMCRAARSGHFEVVKWLHSRGCSLDQTVFTQAVKYSGNLDMMKWMRANTCPWGVNTFAMAARKGYLPVLDWLKSEGCPLGSSAWSKAIWGGRRSVLLWLQAQGCPFDSTMASSTVNRRYGSRGTDSVFYLDSTSLILDIFG